MMNNLPISQKVHFEKDDSELLTIKWRLIREGKKKSYYLPFALVPKSEFDAILLKINGRSPDYKWNGVEGRYILRAINLRNKLEERRYKDNIESMLDRSMKQTRLNNACFRLLEGICNAKGLKRS